jgi:hypothetical protein
VADIAEEIQGLQGRIYDLRVALQLLERQIADQEDAATTAQFLTEIVARQAELHAVEEELETKQKEAAQQGQVDGRPGAWAKTRSMASTGLEVQVQPGMAHVPTAYYHLLDPEQHPLVTCTVTTSASNLRRVRISSFIEGYSATAVDTVEVKKGMIAPPQVRQQPPLFPDKVHSLNELTRANLNILAEDLDTGKTEVHRTFPLWLLARTSAPLSVYDPAHDQWKDMSQYLGAFVTPNHPSVMTFVRTVANQHPSMRLAGYQDDVDVQVRAAFDALKTVAKLVYVSSVIDFNPDAGAKSQRLRLPRQSLEERQANCIDGTVLFASILESISLNPAIVVLPTHVIVAWETAKNSNDWRYLDTTKIDSRTFEEAVSFGQTLAKAMEKQAAATNNEAWFRRWPLRELRSVHGIYPME